MAYDKIYTIHARLYDRICYILDPAKTTADSGLLLQYGLNCDLLDAYREMMHTKARWDKQNGVQGYHLIHSYAPGEIDPEQAHALGVELADRLVGDRFEAVVATHIDHAHIHCHTIFNSVSFMDGRKYRSNFKAYYGDIRGTSNAISRENGLSVIEPRNHGRHYVEWEAERQGKPNIRDLIRQDMDAAIEDSFTYQSFFVVLEKRGYTVKRGPNVSHAAVRPPGGSRFIRLDSLGDGYTEAGIMERLKGVRAGQKKQPELPNIPVVTLAPGRRCTVKRGHLDHHPGQKLHGIRALYVRYLYILGVIGVQGQRRRPVPFNVRSEVRRLDRYKEQFRLLHNYHVETTDQLSMLRDALQTNMEAEIEVRRGLYRRKRRGEDVDGEIAMANRSIWAVRKEIRICDRIAAELPGIREQVEEYTKSQKTARSIEKDKSKDRERRSTFPRTDR